MSSTATMLTNGWQGGYVRYYRYSGDVSISRQSKSNGFLYFGTHKDRESATYEYFHTIFIWFHIDVPSGKRIVNAKLNTSTTQGSAVYPYQNRYVLSEAPYDASTEMQLKYFEEGKYETEVLNENFAFETSTSFNAVPLENLNVNGDFCIKIYTPFDRIAIEHNSSVMFFPSDTSTSFTPTITYDIEDIPPDTPTIIQPLGDIVDKSQTYTFKWRFNSASGDAQTGFDFAYRSSGGSWSASTHVDTEVSEYVPDMSTWSTGIIEWRVRTYNINNLYSDWATASFELLGPPQAPSIVSISNEAVPTIKWQASSTESATYEAEIVQGGVVLWSSGEQAGLVSREFKPDAILANGDYIVRMRVASIYELWSNWTGKSFTLSATVPEEPDIDLEVVGPNIKLTNTVEGDKILYRSENGTDYTPIARYEDLEYIDATVEPGKTYSYFIRLYDGSYADSDVVTGTVYYDGYYVAAVSDLMSAASLKLNTDEPYITIARQFTNTVAYNEFLGRKYQVKESGTLRTEEFSGIFYLSKSEFANFKAIFDTNGIFLIRGKDFAMYCDLAIDGVVSALLNKGYDVTIRGIRVHYDSEVHFNV